MYELRNGTARLIYAIHRHCSEDEIALRKMSLLLNYEPRQLQQDIRAAVDFYDKFRDKVEVE